MAVFAQLTERLGRHVVVNVEAVAYLEPDKTTSNETMICFIDGRQSTTVKGAIQDVTKQLEDEILKSESHRRNTAGDTFSKSALRRS
jgi:hypothetical protein